MDDRRGRRGVSHDELRPSAAWWRDGGGLTDAKLTRLCLLGEAASALVRRISAILCPDRLPQLIIRRALNLAPGLHYSRCNFDALKE